MTRGEGIVLHDPENVREICYEVSFWPDHLQDRYYEGVHDLTLRGVPPADAAFGAYRAILRTADRSFVDARCQYCGQYLMSAPPGSRVCCPVCHEWNEAVA